MAAPQIANPNSLKMKKLIIILALLISSSCALMAQTSIKTNALYWAAGVPNVSLEVGIARKWSYNVDLVYSPWEEYINKKPMVVGQFINEFRFYPKQVNKGFYVGGYGAWHEFKLSKWNYDYQKYQVGYGMSFGVTVGYELPISNRWLIDFYAGGGWQVSWYRGFRYPSGEMYVGWNGSGEWIPYKIGVAFSYRLSKKSNPFGDKRRARLQ